MCSSPPALKIKNFARRTDKLAHRCVRSQVSSHCFCFNAGRDKSIGYRVFSVSGVWRFQKTSGHAVASSRLVGIEEIWVQPHHGDCHPASRVWVAPFGSSIRPSSRSVPWFQYQGCVTCSSELTFATGEVMTVDCDYRKLLMWGNSLDKGSPLGSSFET